MALDCRLLLDRLISRRLFFRQRVTEHLREKRAITEEVLTLDKVEHA